MEAGNWDRKAVRTQAFVGSEDVPVTWKQFVGGTCICKLLMLYRVLEGTKGQRASIFL